MDAHARALSYLEAADILGRSAVTVEVDEARALLAERALLLAVVRAVKAWDHADKRRTLHVFQCSVCRRLQLVAGCLCDEAEELARAQTAAGGDLKEALAALPPDLLAET